jgi:hypothetical protein
MTRAALSIDYGNFKETIAKNDWQRHSVYMKVWEILHNRQEQAVSSLPRFKNPLKYTGGRKK